MSTSGFYDDLSGYYHLIFADWQASIDRQARALDLSIRSEGGPEPHTVLIQLMKEGEFQEVRCVEGVFCQPLIVGHKQRG